MVEILLLILLWNLVKEHRMGRIVWGGAAAGVILSVLLVMAVIWRM